jgi:hypothetical protein
VNALPLLELPLFVPMFGHGPFGAAEDEPLGVVPEGALALLVAAGAWLDGVACACVVEVDVEVDGVAVVPVDADAPLIPAAAPAVARAPATIAVPASLRMCTGIQLSLGGWLMLICIMGPDPQRTPGIS